MHLQFLFIKLAALIVAQTAIINLIKMDFMQTKTIIYGLTILLSTCFAVSAQQAMVVSSHHLASKVGIDILQQGGNAIDAAVAVGYALAVVDPCCGNIGGGGFMLIHFAAGKNTFINFRETSPLASKPQLYLDQQGQSIPQLLNQGYLAVAVPGTVMGLNTTLTKYGTMPLKNILQPAIKLAKEGFILQQGDIDILAKLQPYITPHSNVATTFLKNGLPYQLHDRLVQTDLAHSLTTIAQQGTKAFYQGSIAQQLVNANQQHGGVLTIKDLLNYKIAEVDPLYCHYHDYTVATAPLPSGGGITLCEMLAITEAYPLKQWGYHSPQSLHIILEAMRYAYADRNRYLGDATFINNPLLWLLSPQHIQAIRDHIRPNLAGDSTKLDIATPTAGQHTTHYAVMDRYGNAVAVTYTLNSYFGAKVIAGKTGFFLNNEMDDFTITPGTANAFQLQQGLANLLQGGKQPLSSMAPTILFKDHKPFMLVGAAGGSTIPTQILAIIENVIDYNLNIKAAIDAPRFHMQWQPDQVFIEPNFYAPITLARLQMMGYHFHVGSPYGTKTWGVAAALLRDPITQRLYGASDSRRVGSLAIGY